MKVMNAFRNLRFSLRLMEKILQSLRGIIDSALSADTEIYTNCLDETPISRLSIIGGTENKDFFSKYVTTLTKSWKLVTGTKTVYRVERRL
jgi:hypothetical protein